MTDIRFLKESKGNSATTLNTYVSFVALL